MGCESGSSIGRNMPSALGGAPVWRRIQTIPYGTKTFLLLKKNYIFDWYDVLQINTDEIGGWSKSFQDHLWEKYSHWAPFLEPEDDDYDDI